MALALGAALGWGIADFLAGRTSRQSAALIVLCASQWIGFAIVAGTVIVVGLPSVATVDLFYAWCAGVATTIGLGALYRAMVVGAIALAAPVGATGVAIPIAVGLASGDDPSTLQALGLVVAVFGVVLCSRDTSSERARAGCLAAGVGASVLAALGLGVSATSLAEASSAGVWWVLLVQRATVGSLAFAAIVVSGEPRSVSGAVFPAIAAIGVLDLAATALFTLSTTHGALSVVAVVAALYPVVTVVLAFALLSERLAAHQTVGVVAALAGVAAISSG